MPATFRPAGPLRALRRHAAGRGGRRARRGRGRGAVRADGPRHGRRRAGGGRAARDLGLRFSPAAELSAVHGGHEDLHILGYELDVTDPDLIATLEDFRGDRARRIEAMADRLRELGFELDDTPLVARREAGKPIGRPHLADAVLAHPANAERLPTRASTAATSCSALPRPGRDGLRRAQPPDRRRGDRGHPRGRRRRRLGAPVLGRRRPEEAIATLETFADAGSTASSASTSPTPRSRPACCTSSRAAAAC